MRPNARGLAYCGWARQVTLYTNFASKKWLKKRAVAIRLQPLVRPPFGWEGKAAYPFTSVVAVMPTLLGKVVFPGLIFFTCFRWVATLPGNIPFFGLCLFSRLRLAATSPSKVTFPGLCLSFPLTLGRDFAR